MEMPLLPTRVASELQVGEPPHSPSHLGGEIPPEANGELPSGEFDFYQIEGRQRNSRQVGEDPLRPIPRSNQSCWKGMVCLVSMACSFAGAAFLAKEEPLAGGLSLAAGILSGCANLALMMRSCEQEERG